MHAHISPTLDNIFDKIIIFKQINKNLWKDGGLKYN